jgi:hypothetical protein
VKLINSLESAYRAVRRARGFGQRSQKRRGLARETYRGNVVALGESFLRALEQPLREDVALGCVGAEIFAIDSLFDLIDIGD